MVDLPRNIQRNKERAFLPFPNWQEYQASSGKGEETRWEFARSSPRKELFQLGEPALYSKRKKKEALLRQLEESRDRSLENNWLRCPKDFRLRRKKKRGPRYMTTGRCRESKGGRAG